MDERWRPDPPLPKVFPRPPMTSAKEYARPEISKVAVSIETDADEFMPRQCGRDGSATIFANIPSGELVISKGGSSIVDCGFSVEMPAGYRCRVSSLVVGVVLDSVDSKRFKVNVVNLADQTILKDRQAIGKIWVEPIHLFEWITRG